MATRFLIVIYLAFISLGLPDSLLGAAWPVMRIELGASLGTAGILSMTVAAGTIVSSMLSGKIVPKLGTGKVTLISCIMTAGALLGISFAPSLIWLIVCAIPLGLGAGSVDSALNDYIAKHYKAHHMNWLHCFWGVGATAGPIIMSYYIAKHNSWRGGYTAVSVIQFTLVIILFLTLPLWKRVAAIHEENHLKNVSPEEQSTNGTVSGDETVKRNVLTIPGVKPTLIAFIFYCGAESTVGLWGASYLVGARNVSVETAAGWVSLYYGGITLGRLITGFISLKVSNRNLIRYGQLIALAGVILVLIPLPTVVSLVGFILIGLGFAPVFPSLLHETPTRFGSANSASLIGYQMAVAYGGSTFLAPVFGAVAAQTSISLFPVIVLAYVVFMLVSAERVNQVLALRKGKSDR